MSARILAGTDLDKIKWPRGTRDRGRVRRGAQVLTALPTQLVIDVDVDDEEEAKDLLEERCGVRPLSVGLVTRGPLPLSHVDVDELWVDCLHVGSTTIDWAEAYGEDCEGWRSYDATACDECGLVIVGSDGDAQHRDLAPDSGCRGNLNFAQPMMNYYYAIDLCDDELEDAAVALMTCSMCVVQFEDGRSALALTGGGQDMSWDICESFVRLGRLPPVRYARVPRESGRGRHSGRDQVILAACAESFRVVARQANNDLERLLEDFPLETRS